MDLRYPIGKLEPQPFMIDDKVNDAVKQQRLIDLKMLPGFLEQVVYDLDESQLDTPYRPEGWTVKQLVHHVADSHMNAYMRFKHGLTEDNPTIKPYDENAWVLLSDSTNVPINISITLLFALHARWYELLVNMTDEEWQRTVYHPEQKREISLWDLLGIYSWHGKHHAAHVSELRERMNWN